MSSIRSSSNDGTASAPGRERRASTRSANAWNSSFFETGSVSQPTPTIVPVAVDDRADEALGGRAVGPLAGLRHPLLAQERAGGVDVAVGLLQRALAVHHPRAGELAELLDEAALISVMLALPAARRRRRRARRRRGASARIRLAAAAPRARPAGGGLGRCGARARRGLRRGRLASRGRRSTAARLGSAAAPRRAKSFAETFVCPTAMPSATARTTSEHERIASSLPGMTKSASSGSQFVSTRAITGMSRRWASRTASCSFLRSTMKIASGWRLHVGDAAEVRLELLELGLHRDPLLRGRSSSCLDLEAPQLVEVRDPVRDRAPVREQAA